MVAPSSVARRKKINFGAKNRVLTDFVSPPSLLPNSLVVQECPVGREIENAEIKYRIMIVKAGHKESKKTERMAAWILYMLAIYRL